MSQRAVVAAEIQHLLEQLQLQIDALERIAMSSGLVNPMHFRAMRTMAAGAAGDLDQKGLLIREKPIVKEPA